MQYCLRTGHSWLTFGELPSAVGNCPAQDYALLKWPVASGQYWLVWKHKGLTTPFHLRQQWTAISAPELPENPLRHQLRVHWGSTSPSVQSHLIHFLTGRFLKSTLWKRNCMKLSVSEFLSREPNPRQHLISIRKEVQSILLLIRKYRLKTMSYQFILSNGQN